MEMLKIGNVSINLDALHGLTHTQAEKRLSHINGEIVKQILAKVKIKPEAQKTDVKNKGSR